MKKSAVLTLIILSLFYLAAEAKDGTPSVPTNVQASDGTYMDKVQVTWTASLEATSYTVYRGAYSNTFFASPLGSTSETFYHDVTAAPNKIYYYWVKTSNAYGTSSFSAYDAGSRSDGRPPVPTNVSASDGTYVDKVQVSWTASSWATSYTVYRAKSSYSWDTKTALGTTSNTTFDDTTAPVMVTYYYYVQASNSYGASGHSAPDAGSRSDGRPPVPTNVSASDGTYVDKVKVSWAASSGATSYTVYRAKSSYSWDAKTALGTTSNTTFDDTTAPVMVTYYYYVQASNSYGASGHSPPDAGSRADGRPPVPTNVSASDGTYVDKVKVSWAASSGATSYTVYRAKSSYSWDAKTALGTTSNTTFDDTTAPVMVTYYYYVQASNSNGTSGYSPPDAGSRSDARPPVPTNVSASDGTYVDKVQVTWTASPGATSYTIYRAALWWETKTALGTTSDITYDDTTALAGKIYYYYIRATNANGTSDFSVYDTGWWRGPTGIGSPQFRAIGGVSMGAYGAMNIGLGRPDFFNTIASLGGPLDMSYLLKFIEVDMLGNYDNPSPYPNRDTLINMLKDLTISFGNPVYYNPLSTYYPPGITAEDARVPTTLLNFMDKELNPDGNLPVITYEDPAPGDWVEVLLALDLNGNEKRDPGEPILKQFYEPFTDTNGNGIYDTGEPFADSGLDGVPGTGDFGEDDGKFTYNLNHDNYFAEDPLRRAYGLSLANLQGLNLYIDAGTEDEFQFDIHADNFVQTLNDRGLVFRSENGFPVDFPRISHFDEKRVYVRYPGGHVGVDKENIGLTFEQAKQGIEGAIVVANRFTTLFSFVSDHFTGGSFGTDLYELLLYPSKMGVVNFTSSSLNRSMKFGIYLPPGYSRSSTDDYPVLYLLLGYNMSVEGMANSWVKAALDAFILAGEMQKMIIVIPDGLNYKNQSGHFFVNQIDQQRGDKFKDYFFDLVTFIDTNYKTK